MCEGGGGDIVLWGFHRGVPPSSRALDPFDLVYVWRSMSIIDQSSISLSKSRNTLFQTKGAICTIPRLKHWFNVVLTFAHAFIAVIEDTPTPSLLPPQAYTYIAWNVTHPPPFSLSPANRRAVWYSHYTDVVFDRVWGPFGGPSVKGIVWVTAVMGERKTPQVELRSRIIPKKISTAVENVELINSSIKSVSQKHYNEEMS